MTPAGLPHSDIPGSTLACSSPRLFAACHVLHRRLVPRHPPCALIRLTHNLPSTTTRVSTGSNTSSFACPPKAHHTSFGSFTSPKALSLFTLVVKKLGPPAAPKEGRNRKNYRTSEAFKGKYDPYWSQCREGVKTGWSCPTFRPLPKERKSPRQ